MFSFTQSYTIRFFIASVTAVLEGNVSVRLVSLNITNIDHAQQQRSQCLIISEVNVGGCLKLVTTHNDDIRECKKGNNITMRSILRNGQPFTSYRM